MTAVFINQNELNNLSAFIYKHEQNLQVYGGIKIQLDRDCRLALKKRKKGYTSLKRLEKLYLLLKMSRSIL